MNDVNKAQVGIAWYFFLLITVVLGFLLHEGAHWLAGEALGYDMKMTIGKAWPVGGSYRAPVHYQIIGMAGPIFTILVAILGLFAALRYDAIWGYALIFSSFLMRLLAFGVSFSSLNDEARISVYLGLAWYVLPMIVVGGLFWMTVVASRALHIGWRTNVVSYLVVSAVITALVMFDGQLPSLGS